MHAHTERIAEVCKQLADRHRKLRDRVYSLKRVDAKVVKRKNCNSARQHSDRHPLVRRTSLPHTTTVYPRSRHHTEVGAFVFSRLMRL